MFPRCGSLLNRLILGQLKLDADTRFSKPMEDPGDASSDSVRGAREDTALHLSGQRPVLYTRCVDGIQQTASSSSFQQQILPHTCQLTL